jgi:phosphopantetheinyl transferase
MDISCMAEEVIASVVGDCGVGIEVWFVICHVRSITAVFSAVFSSRST